ncbi:MAG TPA: PKD domain-containing protein [Cytophagaceae bacterium]
MNLKFLVTVTVFFVTVIFAKAQMVYDDAFYKKYKEKLVHEYLESNDTKDLVKAQKWADMAVSDYKLFRKKVDKSLMLRHESPNDKEFIKFTNYNFEEGNIDGWVYSQGSHPGCDLGISTCDASTPTVVSTAVPVNGAVTDRIQIVTGDGIDPIGNFPVVKPGGKYSLKLGNMVNGNQVDRISQTFTVKQRFYTYDIAVLLEDIGHAATDQPFFSVKMYDLDKSIEIQCARYVVVAGAGIPGFGTPVTTAVGYVPGGNIRPTAQVHPRTWTANTVDLKEQVGHKVRIEFTVGDCIQNGHSGYAYIDGGIFDDVITTQGDLCVGQNIKIGNLISGNSVGEDLTWTIGNQPPIKTPSTCQKFNTSGTYEVTLDYKITSSLVSTCTSQVFNKTLVIVNDCNKDLDFTADPLCVNSPIKFSLANPENYLSNNYKFSWNFGQINSNENTSSLREPCHTYGAASDYEVRLNVILDGNECVAAKEYNKIKNISIVNCSTGGLSALGQCSNSPIALKNTTNSLGSWNVIKVEENGTERNVASETASILCKTFEPGSYRATFGSGGTSTTSNGCPGSTTLPPSQVTFIVKDCPRPVITYQGELCTGATISLQSSNTEPYSSLTPRWNIAWQRQIDWDPEKLNKFSFCQKFEYPGDYKLNLSFQPENNGCEGSDALVTAEEKIMTIKDCPPPIIVSPPVCLGKVSQFSLVPSQTATTYVWKFGDGTEYNSNSGVNGQNPNGPTHTYEKAGSYPITVDLTFASQNTCNVPREVKGITGKHNVENCDPKCAIFKPEPGKKYLISGWASEERMVEEATPILNYSHAKLIVTFMTIDNSVVEKFEFATSPNTPIIDGWQKIEGVLTAPKVFSKVSIQLAPSLTDDNVNIYYDDIRFHPFDANMKSSVYDPESLRLMAELDENNYATFYEYDKEGKLIRIKKETERGVKTVKEFRDNMYKVEPN